ncbi:hypothetical protein KSAC_35080 (plasmid) [Komagataeibacter saccharivorans]|nr:hypothetical protein KSAC_35080 [Komagataeibacter saccharivorans]
MPCERRPDRFDLRARVYPVRTEQRYPGIIGGDQPVLVGADFIFAEILRAKMVRDGQEQAVGMDLVALLVQPEIPDPVG